MKPCLAEKLLPVDIDTEAIHDPGVKLKQYASKLEPNVDEIASKRKKMEKNVKVNIELAQNEQKEYYDRKFGVVSCFSVERTVFVKDFKRKKREKVEN